MPAFHNVQDVGSGRQGGRFQFCPFRQYGLLQYQATLDTQQLHPGARLYRTVELYIQRSPERIRLYRNTGDLRLFGADTNVHEYINLGRTRAIRSIGIRSRKYTGACIGPNDLNLGGALATGDRTAVGGFPYKVGERISQAEYFGNVYTGRIRTGDLCIGRNRFFDYYASG